MFIQLEENEYYWVIDSFGDVRSILWTNDYIDTGRYNQGNSFKTKEEAEREYDKRELLTRFRQFRDKCNGDWKPDFKMHNENKYALFLTGNNRNFFVDASTTFNHFHLFGYFKDKEDAALAIELFGDEIRRLFVEVE